MSHNESACSNPSCGYRHLYTGSQVSLSDMASRQAAALSRVGRLRAGIVTTLRRSFPVLAVQAETQLGRRLADTDDEILLAYLEAFTGNAAAAPAASTYAAIREELSRLGIVVRGDDPVDWITQLRGHARPTAVQAPTPTAAKPAGPPVGDLFGDVAPSTPETTARQAFAVTSSQEQSYPPADLYDDYPMPDYPPDDLDYSDYAPYDEPVADSVPATPKESKPADKPEPASDPVDKPAPRPAFATRTPDVASAPASEPAAPVAGPATPETPAAAGNVGELFSDLTLPDLWAGPLGDSSPTDGRWSPSPVRARPAVDSRPAAPAAVPPAPDRAPSTPRPPLATPTPLPEPAPPAKSRPEARPEKPTEAESTPFEVLEEPLRPQIIAGTTSKPKTRKGRQLRTQAQAPDDSAVTMDVPVSAPATPAVLDAGMSKALLAAASIPRPVFTRDLIPVAGSIELVDAWQSECMADPVNYPVRFIVPKTRHRMRGSLVFTDSKTTGGPENWWTRCSTSYRGARLYELAVLLHRVGDEVVSTEFSDDAAILRLNTPRGLVGIVVVFDTRLEPGEAAREALRSALADLVTERLTLVAVLTTSGESGSLEAVLGAVKELGAEEGWTPNAPVVAARSWEFADDRGSSAVLALGG